LATGARALPPSLARRDRARSVFQPWAVARPPRLPAPPPITAPLHPFRPLPRASLPPKPTPRRPPPPRPARRPLSPRPPLGSRAAPRGTRRAWRRAFGRGVAAGPFSPREPRCSYGRLRAVDAEVGAGAAAVAAGDRRVALGAPDGRDAGARRRVQDEPRARA